MENCITAGLPEPEFESIGGDFTILFKLHKNKVTEEMTEEVTEEVTEEIAILTLILNDNFARTSNIAKSLNFSQSKTERLIKKLKEKGKLEHTGAKKNGKWIVKVTEEVMEEVTEEMTEENLLITELSNKPSATIKQLAYNLKKSTSTIERMLRKLRIENKIERTGSTKTGHWNIIK